MTGDPIKGENLDIDTGRVRTEADVKKENNLSHGADIPKTTGLLIDGDKYKQVNVVPEVAT